MISVKEAVEAATDALRTFYEGESIEDVKLEEVELSAGQGSWLITLGFTQMLTRPTTGGPLGALMGGIHYERKYKVFTVDADDKSVRSMKIRVL